MASDWHALVGTFGQLAGTSGTVTLPAGACALLISAHASANGAYFTIFGGPQVPVINGAATIIYEFTHTLVQATSSNSGTIVFSGTDHYYIQYFKPGNA